MQRLFGFCLRFFAAFVAAKLLLRPFGADNNRGLLLLLSALLTVNLYWLDFIEIREQLRGWWERRRWSHRHKDERGLLCLPPPTEPPENR